MITKHNDTHHNCRNCSNKYKDFQLNGMLNAGFLYGYAECCYDEYRYAQCSYVYCHQAECHYAVCC
jgi:hypothetical protein